MPTKHWVLSVVVATGGCTSAPVINIADDRVHFLYPQFSSVAPTLTMPLPRVKAPVYEQTIRYSPVLDRSYPRWQCGYVFGDPVEGYWVLQSPDAGHYRPIEQLVDFVDGRKEPVTYHFEYVPVAADYEQ